MRLLLVLLPLLVCGSEAWAKCWPSGILAPVFCGEVEVKEQEDTFTMVAAIKSFSIPEAQSQDLSRFTALKSQGTVALDIPESTPALYKKGDVVSGIFEANCRDWLQNKPKRRVAFRRLSDDEIRRTLGNKSLAIRCPKVTRSDQ